MSKIISFLLKRFNWFKCELQYQYEHTNTGVMITCIMIGGTIHLILGFKGILGFVLVIIIGEAWRKLIGPPPPRRF